VPVRAFILVVVLAIATGRANAYPQFQLSRDQTCTGCHLSPAGGGLLNENGLNLAEVISKFGTDPAFLNGAVEPPSWLALGGDFRGMWGYVQAPQKYLIPVPMQADVYARATVKNFALHVTVGVRPVQEGNEALTAVWAREHYVQWQQDAGSPMGVFVRAGHFMPVFGLRWVEHPVYVRRYGGTPLFSDTYAASASYIQPRYEAHVTGFIKDPLIDPVQRSNGGAAYGELRLDDKTSVGVGGMYENSDYDYKLRGEITAKRYLPGPDVLIQGELQFINPHVDAMAGGTYGYKQLASYLMATYFAPAGVMVDVGWGHHDGNLRIQDLDRDAFDLNVHWFATSHIEAMITSRLELMALGSGGPTGAYAFLQLHYRL
jgi:hypothetical protein